MRLLLCDETNRQPGPEVDFFIYGGLHFDLNELIKIDDQVSQIRAQYNFEPEDELKWTANAIPSRLKGSPHDQAKADVIDLAWEIDAELIPVLLLHEMTGEEPGIHYKRSIRDVLGQFQYVLTNHFEDYGICGVDPVPEGRNVRMLEEVFTQGLTFEKQKDRELNRIKLIGSVSSKASHAASLIDIVLGAFAYCTNHPEYDKSEEIFSNIARLTKGYSEEDGLDYEWGVLLRPKDIGHKPYRRKYQAIRKNLDDLLNRSRQRAQRK